MAIRYSRLISEQNVNYLKCAKWMQNNLPVPFLRQQIGLIGLILASLLLLMITTLFISDVEYDLIRDLPSNDLNFGVVVDCGSSGTRAHIFKWTRNSDKVTQVELVRGQFDGKPLNIHIAPGLSSLRDSPDKASDYMEPIMHFLTESIPPARHSDTQIHFMATAGLRLLDESVQKELLSDITRDLGVKYNFPRIKSQVITGEYEGVYSWLSVNMRKIYNSTSERIKSIGMIEMGGASTQVTFELTPEIENAILKDLTNTDAITTFRNEQVTLKLGHNNSIRLFATTFLGLGVNSARESAIDLLVRDYLNGTGEFGSRPANLESFEVRLMDPCLTSGSSELVQKSVELITNAQQSTGFVVRQHDETFKVRLVGSGNFLNCLDLLDRVLKTYKNERINCHPAKRTCPMTLLGNKFIPYEHSPFLGLSEMFFTTNEMMNLAGPFDRTKVLRETNRICKTNYSTLLEMYSNRKVTYDDRILFECFKASWMLTILHNSGFMMPNSYANFTTADRLDGREIDWTIGAMLSEVALNEISRP